MIEIDRDFQSYTSLFLTVLLFQYATRNCPFQSYTSLFLTCINRILEPPAIAIFQSYTSLFLTCNSFV